MLFNIYNYISQIVMADLKVHFIIGYAWYYTNKSLEFCVATKCIYCELIDIARSTYRIYIVVFENVWQNIAIKEIISPYKLNTLYIISRGHPDKWRISIWTAQRHKTRHSRNVNELPLLANEHENVYCGAQCHTQQICVC